MPILLILTALLSPTPTFALNYSASAVLDWSSLTLSGIDFTLSRFLQFEDASVFPAPGLSAQQAGFASDWVTSTQTATLPSIGSATANATATEISGFASLLSAATAQGRMERDVDITALSTGVLTVSVPYRLEHQGQIGGSASLSFLQAFLGIFKPGSPDALAFGSLRAEFADSDLHTLGETRSGTLSVSMRFNEGQTGSLSASASALGTVPGPETFWPFAAGWVLVVLLQGWRAYLLMNNRSEGNAPMTIQALVDRMRS